MPHYPTTTNVYLDASRGVQVNPQQTSVVIFGNNPNQNISTEDVWPNGAVQAIWVPPTAARVHNINSSDASDNSNGSGARTVFISGLDATYTEVSETVVLNGVSNVATVNSYIMINAMNVATTGSDAQNNGTIRAIAQTDLTLTSLIAANANVAQQAIYQVPALTDGFILNFDVSVKGVTGASIFVDLLVKEFGEPYASVYRLYMGDNSGTEQIIFQTPIKVSPKAIIKARAVSNGNNSVISASFSVVKLLNNLAE